jgi:hypothetical protein
MPVIETGAGKVSVNVAVYPLAFHRVVRMPSIAHAAGMYSLLADTVVPDGTPIPPRAMTGQLEHADDLHTIPDEHA